MSFKCWDLSVCMHVYACVCVCMRVCACAHLIPLGWMVSNALEKLKNITLTDLLDSSKCETDLCSRKMMASVSKLQRAHGASHQGPQLLQNQSLKDLHDVWGQCHRPIVIESHGMFQVWPWAVWCECGLGPFLLGSELGQLPSHLAWCKEWPGGVGHELHVEYLILV